MKKDVILVFWLPITFGFRGDLGGDETTGYCSMEFESKHNEEKKRDDRTLVVEEPLLVGLAGVSNLAFLEGPGDLISCTSSSSDISALVRRRFLGEPLLLPGASGVSRLVIWEWSGDLISCTSSSSSSDISILTKLRFLEDPGGTLISSASERTGGSGWEEVGICEEPTTVLDCDAEKGCVGDDSRFGSILWEEDEDEGLEGEGVDLDMVACFLNMASMPSLRCETGWT